MVARVHRLDFRTNLSSSVNMLKAIEEPRPGMMTVVNWMTFITVAEGGDFVTNNDVFIAEGPFPPRDVGGSNRPDVSLDQNSLRDNADLKALVVQHANGGAGAGNIGGGGGTSGLVVGPGHLTFPGGIWSAYEIGVGWRTNGGVDRVTFSLGYEQVNVGRAEWRRWRSTQLNTVDVGRLFQ